MISQLLLATFLYVTVRCLENNNTKYCVVNSGDPGIIIVDPIAGVDYSFIGAPSMFVDNTTKLFNFNEKTKVYNNWNVLCSVENLTHVNEPVLDQRWENFINNHDYDFQSILETPKTGVFLSVRIFNTSVNLRMKEGEWNHLLLAENKTLYACNGVLLDNCTEELNTGYQSVVDYYVNSSILKSIWKLHKYYYLYTTTQTTETIYENKDNNCTDIQTGCIFIYLTMCKECDINLQLNSSATNVTRIIRKGNGTWAKENISLENFTTCFSLTVTTEATNNTEDINNDELFWALGDIGYLSTTQNCKDIKRYTSVDMSDTINSYLICENTFNQNIDFVFELPKEEQKSNDVVNETHQSPELSSFNPVFLLIIIPGALVIIAALVTFWWISKQRNKNGNKLINDNSIELLKLSDEDASLPYRDKWPAIKTGDFTSYVRKAFDPNHKCDYLRVQFSELPSGHLKCCDVGKNAENLEKNRCVKIYPYDENRVKLEKSLPLGHIEHSDYINASYVQGYDNPKEYIVTQNPLSNTAADFFRMIWQETVEHIVMISSDDEELFCYWPNLKKRVAYGDIEICLNEIHSYKFYNHRVLKIRRFGQKRKIHQLHFYAWSHEMLSSHIFLDFVAHLLKIPHRSSPVVFHSLAGVGKSATILLCDMALRISAISGYVDLFGLTKQLRECRADMVQNLKQYQLAHLIVYESLNHEDTGAPIKI